METFWIIFGVVWVVQVLGSVACLKHLNGLPEDHYFYMNRSGAWVLTWSSILPGIGLYNFIVLVIVVILQQTKKLHRLNFYK